MKKVEESNGRVKVWWRDEGGSLSCGLLKCNQRERTWRIGIRLWPAVARHTSCFLFSFSHRHYPETPTQTQRWNTAELVKLKLYWVMVLRY